VFNRRGVENGSGLMFGDEEIVNYILSFVDNWETTNCAFFQCRRLACPHAMLQMNGLFFFAYSSKPRPRINRARLHIINKFLSSLVLS